jgi:deoxyribodipyrimidine photo-lyase
MSKPRIVLHIFHRDLRTVDNAALATAAAKASSTKSDLVTLFIFTPEQVGDANKYKSSNSIEFMLNSLDDLDDQLNGHLSVVYSTQLETLVDLSKKYTIVAITEQRDYTPYAKKRETDTLFFATQNDIEYIVEEDLYLTNPGDVTNKQGRMFQKFTPFYDNAKTRPVPKPKGKVSLNRIHSKLAIKTTTLKAMRAKLVPKSNPDLHVKGGRKEALKLLDSMPKDYSKDHDTPSISTSNLSAHNHFGTVSIREVYHALGNHEFRRQLYWRDFYGHITAFFEDLYDVSPYDFQREHQSKWSYDKTEFNKWANGKTGHELVDAAMNQLKKTGYIHNRARLVAAIYLTKHLKIYWRWGETHFAQHLVDYDFSQNFGNWCWCASVLPFSMATFRSLDPEVQLKKFDPDRKYVGQWLTQKQPKEASE